MDKLIKCLLSILAIVVVAAGLALVIKKTIKNETMKWNGALFASDYCPIMNEFPSASDVDEAILIVSNLEISYKFKESNLHAGSKTIYQLPGNLHTVISVFEIIDTKEQESIIQSAQIIKKQANTRPFSIEFYAKETGPAPRDQFLRKVRID